VAQQGTLGRYRIVGELGRGAMGVVYRAVDPQIARTVALKTITIDRNDAEQRAFYDLFLSEARAAGRLSHPNIVTVYDCGETSECAYIAMEFLEGVTLRAMLDQERFVISRSVRYAIQIAEGLANAHNAGIVHRDIKPGNVMRLDNGTLKITDFGIAQMPAARGSEERLLLGSPGYMSPEQVRGSRLDGRSDLFSLGVVLYEMLTGSVPFNGNGATEVMYQVVSTPPLDPRGIDASIPEELVAILAKCLQKDASKRYQDAENLVADLRQYRSEPVELAVIAEVFRPPKVAQPSRAGKPSRKSGKSGKSRSEPGWAIGASVAATILAIGAVGIWWLATSDESEAQKTVSAPEPSFVTPATQTVDLGPPPDETPPPEEAPAPAGKNAARKDARTASPAKATRTP
jgi:eukaryotic-like serine/threonine-protein kinase